MNDPDRGRFVIERVIAAFDPCVNASEMLPMAVDVAARLGAPVSGLFIEDENLVRMCALPAARHLAFPVEAAPPLTSDWIEAELRSLAARAKTALGAAAEQRRVPWSFRVVRGRPGSALNQGTMVRDLLVLSRAPASGLSLSLDSPLHDAVQRLARTTLHVPRQSLLERPVVVLKADSPLMERTIAAAMQLEGGKHRELPIWLAGPRTNMAHTGAAITAGLVTRGYTARIGVLEDSSIDGLSHVLRGSGADVLVIAADVPFPGGLVPEALQRLGIPLMIVH